MDFHSLARRDLQALCKLNAIPANITNVAMADALNSLDIVEGIEEFMNRSPERKAVTAAKVPRTGRRTCTKSIPIGDASESVQPMTKSTRRTTRRAISDEIMEESKTPAIRSTRKTVEPVKMESEGIENVVMKDVTGTPALATYSRRNQVARKSSVKEVTTVQRAYSTRRSARLTENKAVEEKEEKIDSLVTELSRIGLGDGSDNKSLSETVNNLKENEAVDEVNAVQEDDTKSLVIEDEKETDILEEVVDVLEEKSKQLDESQFVADSSVIKDEDNKVLGYPMDTENSHEQAESDEAAPESGMELKEDDAQEIVVDELKEKSEDESHFVQEVNAYNVVIEDEETKVEKSNLEDAEENETNTNMESAVLGTAELSAGGYIVEQMTYSDESKDEILNNKDPKEDADQTELNSIACFMSSAGNEDEMDSGKSFLDEVEPSIGDSEVVQQMTCFEESKADILNNNHPEIVTTGTEISSIAPFVSYGGAENDPVTKTPSVKGLNCVSDDKENINGNGIKFEPTEEEAKKNKKNELNAKSLRELTKMLKEKLQITNNTAEEIGKVTKERPALQKLEDNCQR